MERLNREQRPAAVEARTGPPGCAGSRQRSLHQEIDPNLSRGDPSSGLIAPLDFDLIDHGRRREESAARREILWISQSDNRSRKTAGGSISIGATPTLTRRA